MFSSVGRTFGPFNQRMPVQILNDQWISHWLSCICICNSGCHVFAFATANYLVLVLSSVFIYPDYITLQQFLYGDSCTQV